MYTRYFWQEIHHTYGHLRCVYTVLANLIHMHQTRAFQFCYREPVTGQACNPRNPHRLLSFPLRWKNLRYQKNSVVFIYVGIDFYCLRSFSVLMPFPSGWCRKQQLSEVTLLVFLYSHFLNRKHTLRLQ